ncbi:HAD family hydrolase [Stappia sp. BW2]|uniref:HAD family hydrolase n=1 Tax=Stappia sp. BW2 TaxID=2592622 RepID=UPI0011DEA8BF|nr:HAD family hydrolase [Stappia sp. BW2]TYC75954.1 HAD family hydrolase [Stappia sp. BW2]
MIVFDLDDTLYLERDFAFSGYRYLDGWMKQREGISGFGNACQMLFEEGERRHIFNRALESLGHSGDGNLIPDLVAAYRGHTPQITLAPDAARYLEHHSGPFGLITDGPAATQNAKIVSLGVEQWIDHIRKTGDWPQGYGKPHPRAYEEMEERAADGGPMVYVADNPAKDFVTPKARGWITVQIRRTGAVHSPHAKEDAYAAHVEITSLDELDAALKEQMGHRK